MKKLIVGLMLLVSLGFMGCTDAEKATHILKANNYTNISMDGCNFMSCGKGDWYRTGFVATAPNGEMVSGTVCEGLLFKGATIRLD